MALLIKLYRERIGVRIFILYTILITALCATFFTFFSIGQMDALRSKLINEGTLLVELLAYNSRLSIFTESEKLLETSVAAVQDRKNVLLVSIFNSKGKVMITKVLNTNRTTPPLLIKHEQSNSDALTQLKSTTSTSYFETEDSFEFWAPVFSSVEYTSADAMLMGNTLPQKNIIVIGYVHLKMNKHGLKSEQHKLIYKSVILCGVFLVIGLTLAYLVVQTITRPINKLTNTVRNYGITGQISNSHTYMEDEIGILAKAFNEMGKLVQKNTEELSSTVLQLKEEVQERKKAQDIVMELNATLDMRVQEEIRKQREQEKMLIQQSKMASLGEMISAISHQWRQPLTTLSILNINLQDAFEYGELNQEYLMDCLVKSEEQIQFMSKTIDDFRNFFKPEKEKEQCNLIEVVGEAMSLFSAQLKVDKISYTISCRNHGYTTTDLLFTFPCTEYVTSIYRNEFKQVLLIIINNAKDAIIENRLRGNLKANEKGLIQIELANVEGVIVTRVSDNGGGIPESILDRIYEPYFTTKFKSRGTGIGLYMAKVIVENNLRGNIYSENIINGARFTIELNK